MIYEIRDYHYSPDKFDQYKTWAEDAVPILKKHLDVVGFWVDSGTEPEQTGNRPETPSIGHANITWIIRWESLEQRAERFPEAVGSAEWKAVWAQHPDAEGYDQMLSRFVKAI